MGLDLNLYYHGVNIRSMNWLRNPFGLCQYVEDNAHYIWGEYRTRDDPNSLYYVCNHWAYDNAENVDRPHFLRVVKEYHATIEAADQLYYWFDEQSAEGFGVHFEIDKGWPRTEHKIGYPMELFATGFNLGRTASTEAGKAWLRELVDLAEVLQDTNLEFSCTN